MPEEVLRKGIRVPGHDDLTGLAESAEPGESLECVKAPDMTEHAFELSQDLGDDLLSDTGSLT